ncbi:MAG: CDP-alcohol phosphatidyltransferase family protein [Bulleidia sp.]
MKTDSMDRMGMTAADRITVLRIIGSIALLFTQPLSTSFMILYVLTGITDMLDGMIARKLHCESEHGALLDTISDGVFAAVCLSMLLPVIVLPAWVYVLIVLIVVIKVINVISSFLVYHTMVSVHSMLNKATGFVLFVFPLTLQWIPVEAGAGFICVLALIAAVQEGHMIRSRMI